MTKADALVTCIVGTRPNLVKIAPVLLALESTAGIRCRLVHTGQHHDADMSGSFFEELGIREPDVNLEVASGSQTTVTAGVMVAFEKEIEGHRPDAVLVVGDVTSTLACSLVATKHHLPLFHVEAGLRSGDWRMPEEVNRVLVDRMADALFVTERSAFENLNHEGIAAHRVHFVGNVMVDSLQRNVAGAVPAAETLQRVGLDPTKAFVLCTLHRPSNVDDPRQLEGLLRALAQVAEHRQVLMPVHPRTAGRIREFGLGPLVDSLQGQGRFELVPPFSYLTMLGAMAGAELVLTDSGGVQEETTALDVPCLTLRDNTERPITVEEGTNEVVGTDPQVIVAAALRTLRSGGKRGKRPELWDGHAAERIAVIVSTMLKD